MWHILSHNSWELRNLLHHVTQHCQSRCLSGELSISSSRLETEMKPWNSIATFSEWRCVSLIPQIPWRLVHREVLSTEEFKTVSKIIQESSTLKRACCLALCSCKPLVANCSCKLLILLVTRTKWLKQDDFEYLLFLSSFACLSRLLSSYFQLTFITYSP